MTIDNEITILDWDNTISSDWAMNVGYDDDVRLMNILFALMTID